MFSTTLLGTRWGDLSEELRHTLLERADILEFAEENGEYSEGMLHFHNTMLGVRAVLGSEKQYISLGDPDIIIDEDAVISLV